MLKSFNTFVNEAKREGIFKGGLRPGASPRFLERARKTKAYAVLKFIYEFGEEGCRYTDILRFLVEKFQGREYDPKIDRGIWGNNLIDDPASSYYYNDDDEGSEVRRGLLITYTDKTEDGKYKLKPEFKRFFDLESYHDLKDLGVSSDSLKLLSRVRTSDLI